MTTEQLDLQFVRGRFPAFSEPSLQGWAHFENAGGSYACGPAIDRLQRYYVANKVQPYAWSDAAIEAGRQMDAARERMAAWLNVATDEVHFGPSTTQNTYVLGQAFRQHFELGDEIIVTNLDHEANIGAFRRLADEGFVVREWQIDPATGELDPEGLERLLTDRTRVVAFTHCSNIVGGYNPVTEVVRLARSAGAITVVDGVSFCGHGLPDVAALEADIYLFSLYKVYGPHLGVMTMRRAVNERLPAQCHDFNAGKVAARFTPAGPDHGQIAATNGVIDYFETVHDHHFGAAVDAATMARRVCTLFQAHEHALLQPLLDHLDARPDVRLLGRLDAAARAPTIALDTLRPPVDVAAALAEHRVGASAGHFYAPRCLEAMGIDPQRGVLRLSFVHYTTQAEIDQLVAALDHALAA
ncbi:MAG: aminotransferase class V-fold PLP-dependent enzyme [Pseudomonadota bacterium]